MKKIMFMLMMAMTANMTFAQDDLVKEAKKQLGKNEFDQAIQTLAPALTSDATVDKAKAWNLQQEILFKKYEAILAKETQNQIAKKNEPYDTVGMNLAAVDAWLAALKCDEYDQLPDAKGKVKLDYRTAMQNRYKNFGVNLVQIGQTFYKSKDNKNAFKAWSAFVDMPKSSIYADVKDFPKESYYSDIAYYAAFIGYQLKDYANAEKYALIAAEDTAKLAEATDIIIFSKKDNMKTAADSTAYVAYVKDMHKKHPENTRFFNLLMEYYTRSNNQTALGEWADEEIALDPQNKMAWTLKGEVLRGQEKWDEAAEAYKKGVEIDPTFVLCVFNTGICYNSKAIALKDQLADKNTGGLTKANADKVKAVLAQAKEYLEKSRELDPEQKIAKWPYPLYQIYYSLGDKEKAAEMEALLENK